MATGSSDPNRVRTPRPGTRPVPGAEDLARFWDLSLAMMGVGNFDGYFTLVNPAYQEPLGWSVDELMSVPYWEFVHPEDRHALVESGERLIGGTAGARLGHEVRMLGRDGRYRWTRWNTKALPQEQLFYEFRIRRPGGSLRLVHSAGRPAPGPDGEPECIRGITVDVTDRRRPPPPR